MKVKILPTVPRTKRVEMKKKAVETGEGRVPN